MPGVSEWNVSLGCKKLRQNWGNGGIGTEVNPSRWFPGAMITNDLSYGIAERLDAVLKTKGITQHELASRLGKRDSEVSKWLTGRHNFTTSTIARIEQAIGAKLIQISK